MINTKKGSTKRAFAIYRYLLLASNYFQQISERNGIGQTVELPNEKPALFVLYCEFDKEVQGL